MALARSPLRGQIAWQTQAASGKLLAGGVSPHVILRRCLATPIESHHTDITHFFFGQALRHEQADQAIAAIKSEQKALGKQKR